MATRHLIRTVILQTLYEWDFYSARKMSRRFWSATQEFAPGSTSRISAGGYLKGVADHFSEIDEHS